MTHSRKSLSLEKIRVFRFLKTPDWVTTDPIAEACSVSLAMVQRFTKDLEKAKVVERISLHPTRYFRMAKEVQTEAGLKLIQDIETIKAHLLKE